MTEGAALQREEVVFELSSFGGEKTEKEVRALQEAGTSHSLPVEDGAKGNELKLQQREHN